MDADRICLQHNGTSVYGTYRPLLCHLQHPRNGLLLIFNHRAGLAARYKSAVRLITPVGKYLAADAQPQCLCGLDHLTARKRQQHSLGGSRLDCAADGCRQLRVIGCHIVQCAVRLDMVQRHPGRVAEGLQRADLIDDIRLSLRRRDCHFAASKPLQIWQARMRTYLHAVFFTEQHTFLHHRRITRMKTASNVGRAYKGQYLGIHADRIGAEALPQITVQINGRHTKASF